MNAVKVSLTLPCEVAQNAGREMSDDQFKCDLKIRAALMMRRVWIIFHGCLSRLKAVESVRQISICATCPLPLPTSRYDSGPAVFAANRLTARAAKNLDLKFSA